VRHGRLQFLVCFHYPRRDQWFRIGAALTVH